VGKKAPRPRAIYIINKIGDRLCRKLGGHPLTRASSVQARVGLINDPVGVRIGNEEAEVDLIRARTTVDVRNPDGDDLFVSHAC
jgi:hypothetical protein